jgi:hypothetical protein
MGGEGESRAYFPPWTFETKMEVKEIAKKPIPTIIFSPYILNPLVRSVKIALD